MNTKPSCPHIAEFKKHDSRVFRLLHQWFVMHYDFEAKVAKHIKNTHCYVCSSTRPYIHVCTQCVFFGCHKHIREHAKAKKHCFTLDVSYGQVHCIYCNDYVYDTSLDRIAFENAIKAKKYRKRLINWKTHAEPDDTKVESNPTLVASVTTRGKRGLRGLVNMGNTCYMNCIVQILMHTPVLREYFLSEIHKCKDGPGKCLVCELSRLYQEFYRGQCIPLALNKLTHMTWIRAEQLAGQDQQDAHHFFIATLDALHQECAVAMASVTPQEASNKCPCIIDQIFSGFIQSDVICKLCRSVSTKIDPLWDISLELGQIPGNESQSSSLVDCLERFTSTEHLTLVMCSNCQSYQNSTKQLTVKTAPIVLCFHLKRIEVNKISNKKIDTKIAFPEMLDMSPFMSKHKEALIPVIPIDNRYSLFGVVNHLGGPSTGHYIAYIRHQRDEWYKCDDHRITRVSLDQVLGSEGYLLFYHQHMLGYE